MLSCVDLAAAVGRIMPSLRATAFAAFLLMPHAAEKGSHAFTAKILGQKPFLLSIVESILSKFG